MRDIVTVLIGLSLAVVAVYSWRATAWHKAERRAVKAFRESYKSAWFLLAAAEGGEPSETDVMYMAIEGLRVRTDIKAGKHRFGESASEIVKREEVLAEQARYQSVMSAPPNAWMYKEH